MDFNVPNHFIDLGSVKTENIDFEEESDKLRNILDFAQKENLCKGLLGSYKFIALMRVTVRIPWNRLKPLLSTLCSKINLMSKQS